MTTVVFIVAVLYFVPTIVAVCRGHQHGSVLVLNLLLGWTLLGWVGALAIAVGNKPAPAWVPNGLPSVGNTPVLGSDARTANAQAQPGASVPPPAEEDRIATVRPHWCALRHDVTGTVLALAGGLAGHSIIGRGAISIFLWYWALFMILRLAWKICSWRASRVMFTASRIYLSPGISGRIREVLFLTPGSEVYRTTTPLGDVLGYGTVMIWAIGAYGPTAMGVANMPNPESICAALEDAR